MRGNLVLVHARCPLPAARARRASLPLQNVRCWLLVGPTVLVRRCALRTLPPLSVRKTLGPTTVCDQGNTEAANVASQSQLVARLVVRVPPLSRQHRHPHTALVCFSLLPLPTNLLALYADYVLFVHTYTVEKSRRVTTKKFPVLLS